MNKAHLQLYQSTKKLHAAKIRSTVLVAGPDGAADNEAPGGTLVELVFEDESIPRAKYSLAWCNAEGVRAGGYLVQEFDGSEYFEPAETFEPHHHAIPEPTDDA